MKNQENSIIGGNGLISVETIDEDFKAPFDPTFWLGELEDYFKGNEYLASAGFIELARKSWVNDKNK